jgi:AcrR family transcriptional regulator
VTGATIPTKAGPRPLRRDAERNRQRILDAARAAFGRAGLETTMDEIAREAGVGVGTVYRRFPTKELLVEALFETGLAELTAAAEEGLADPDAWEGLVVFLECALAAQASDRGLRELICGHRHGTERITRARERIAPLVEALVERAQEAGALRSDVVASDVALLFTMIDAVMDLLGEVAPGTWRRPFGVVLDGLRARRDGPTPVPGAPLEPAQLDAARAAWRPPGRPRSA